MDQAVLVKSDRDIGAKVIEALGHGRIPVSVWDWTYVPQLEEWQLVIATPWVDQKGLRTSYRALVGALQKANIYSEVPMRRLFLKSPKDPSVKEIEREFRGRKEVFACHQTLAAQRDRIFFDVCAVDSIRSCTH